MKAVVLGLSDYYYPTMTSPEKPTQLGQYFQNECIVKWQLKL